MKTKAIKALFMAAEADPLVKVGGLADVAGSLPKALQSLTAKLTGGYEIEVRLALPFHSAIRKKIPDPTPLCDFEIQTFSGSITAHAFETWANGIRTYLIAGSPIGDDAPVYSPDAAVDGPKYIFFSLAVLELVKKINWQPDILHANDWHTAAAVYALKTQKQDDPFFKDTHPILTIHNLKFMGAGAEAAVDEFGLPPSSSPLLPWWAHKLPFPLGLQTAERIIPVSPSYAQEITTPEYGCGLETFLQNRQEAISGIINGIDQDYWNPAADKVIFQKFSAQNLEDRIANKTSLIKEFSLNLDPALPLIILISRMDPQKGVDLAVEGLRLAASLHWQAILLGTGDPGLEQACVQLEREFPDRIRAAIRFDASLSRRMYAGADILLMPSRYEPCGLAQMIAMRYGCVPLACATGGLKDTIRDADEFLDGTGFLFKSSSAASLVEAFIRALGVYHKPDRWMEIQKLAMRQDFSWQRSAIDYAKIYQSLKEGNN